MMSSSRPRVSSARYTAKTDVHGEYAILTLAGVIDMACAPHVADEVRAALRSRPPRLIFDLSAVTFLATTGMSILMEADRRCRELALDCRVVARGPVTLRPMQQLGIDHMFQLYDSVDLALGVERCPAGT